jgi:hypothetical protein
MNRAHAIGDWIHHDLDSVIVDDLYVKGAALIESEAQAPLVVDTDAQLPRAASLKRFKAVVGRYAQIVKLSRSIKHLQFSFRDAAYVDPAQNGVPRKKRCSGFALEGLDHNCSVFNISR